MPTTHLILAAALLLLPCLARAAGPAEDTPRTETWPARVAAPRTLVPAGREADFRGWCTTGEGAAAFARLRADLDRDWMDWKLPDEPVTYGDPAPSRRTSDKVDRWRDQQDVTGRVGGVAEAATLAWIVTGEERYRARARDLLVATSRWALNPDWRSGTVPGATDIRYNDEAHFRLWRKLPLVFDRLRATLTPEERRLILDHFRARGTASAAWIEKEGSIRDVRRNSIESDLSSHPIRFMTMTGLAGLALWDDLPEAREWWRWATHFYREQFSPWGGDDGGWGEGVAYWRGTLEHAAFQDALLSLGDPEAYALPFWRQTGYFPLYHVQPYLATSFGDLSNAGKFNLEPASADFIRHLARVHQDGFLRAYADLCTDPRPRLEDLGLRGLDRRYPTAAELLLRAFLASHLPLPKPQPLSALPSHRWFRDVGWVSFHSALGQPDDDIHITFVSSPYGSFSHSHAHQNAFILNAFGAGLAINSGFREWHNSPHHDGWVRQTRSKNAILIDGRGQRPRSKAATGRVDRVEVLPRGVWATGDATAAYAAHPEDRGLVRRVSRDLIFVDHRYLVVRDVVELARPAPVQWLLHTERTLQWQGETRTATTRNGPASLSVALAVPPAWEARVEEGFPIPVDPKYVTPGAVNYSATGEWNLGQNRLIAVAPASTRHETWAVLWPARGDPTSNLRVHLEGSGLRVDRPDGTSDRIQLTLTACAIEAVR